MMARENLVGTQSYSSNIPCEYWYNGAWYDFINREFFDVIRATEIPRLDIIPSGVDLYGAEIDLIYEERREYRLRDALVHAIGAYDYILVDCPPALGLLTINALVAAQASHHGQALWGC